MPKSIRIQISPDRKAKKLDRQKNARCTDLDLLARLEPLSCFSNDILRELVSGLYSTSFKKGEVIFGEKRLTVGVHILLRGVAKIIYLNKYGVRKPVALLAPGPIPKFPPQIGRLHFRCEAYSDCRVGSLGWDQFDVIKKTASLSALRRFYESNLTQWYRFPAGSLDVRERLVLTLLQLSSRFGVAESRGTLLRILLSQKDLAALVGASQPRITEHLAKLEREHLLIRQCQQMILRSDKLEGCASASPHDRSVALVRAETQPSAPKNHGLFGLASRTAA